MWKYDRGTHTGRFFASCNQDIQSGGRRSCVHMFIIILALLSHLALRAAFDLISDLHTVEVITVCHILEQRRCRRGCNIVTSATVSLPVDNQLSMSLVFHIKDEAPCVPLCYSALWISPEAVYSLLIPLVTMCIDPTVRAVLMQRPAPRKRMICPK